MDGDLISLNNVLGGIAILAAIALTVFLGYQFVKWLISLAGANSEVVSADQKELIKAALKFTPTEVQGQYDKAQYYVTAAPLSDDEAAHNAAGRSVTFYYKTLEKRPVVLAVVLYAEYQHMVGKGDTENVEADFVRWRDRYIESHTKIKPREGASDWTLTPDEVKLLKGFHHRGQGSHSWTQE